MPQHHASSELREPDQAATDVFAALYERSYDLGPRSWAGHYLAGRGIELELANRLNVSYVKVPAEIWAELRLEFTIEQLRAAGLVTPDDQFLFSRHQLLFWYFHDGWPLYVQARAINGGGEELSPAGLTSPMLYNAAMLQQDYPLVCVCEGCLDTLSALQFDLPAVGVPAVGGFRDAWFELFRPGTHVALLNDGDDAAGVRQWNELRRRFQDRGFNCDIRRSSAAERELRELLRSLKGDWYWHRLCWPAA
jgi:hypothetical protein